MAIHHCILTREICLELSSCKCKSRAQAEDAQERRRKQGDSFTLSPELPDNADKTRSGTSREIPRGLVRSEHFLLRRAVPPGNRAQQ